MYKHHLRLQKKIKLRNKFILILTNETDQSTYDVIEWLISKGEKFLLLNDKDGTTLNVSQILINNCKAKICFQHNGMNYNTDDIKSFWFRRGFIKLNKEFKQRNKFKKFLLEEKRGLKDYFFFELNKKAKVNQLGYTETSKLIQLTTAVRVGLNVPSTLLTNNCSDVLCFLKEKGKIITKSTQSTLSISKGNKLFGLLTSEYKYSDIKNSPKNFFITKFQEQIEKQLELRIFYLNRKFYPMAIFSQGNSRTRLDFRNYDIETPNRNVPYLLPNTLKRKLFSLMKNLNLLSGSIDMIIDKEDNFHFLEVNPLGQFGMVSVPCNYHIEEKIARILSSEK